MLKTKRNGPKTLIARNIATEEVFGLEILVVVLRLFIEHIDIP